MKRFKGSITLVLAAVCMVSALCSKAYSNGEPQDSIAANINAFALDLYGNLKDQEGNLFLSPYSISAALAMTFAGAGGDTKTQMADVLHVDPGQNIHLRFAELEKSLTEKASAGSYQLHIANALWGQEGYPFLASFLTLNRKYYGAALRTVDFIGATEEARQAINTWTEEKTEEKIQELIKPGVLDTLTRLVLTNAIYFKGNWARRFDQKRTKDRAFHVTAEQTKEVPTMCQRGVFAFMQTEALQCLALPYGKGDVSISSPFQKGGLRGCTTFGRSRGLAFLDAKLLRSPEKFSLNQVIIKKEQLSSEVSSA